MRAKAAGWAFFFLCVLGLSFAATSRYSGTADLLLICLRLAAVAGVSILIVLERWRHAGRSDAKIAASSGEGVLQRFQRWYYDEPQRPT